ncbi:hypothetical protein ES703_83271 [subsurface metagenome]
MIDARRTPPEAKITKCRVYEDGIRINVARPRPAAALHVAVSDGGVAIRDGYLVGRVAPEDAVGHRGIAIIAIPHPAVIHASRIAAECTVG